MVTAQTRSNRGSPPHRCPGIIWTHMVSIQELLHIPHPAHTHTTHANRKHTRLSLDQPHRVGHVLRLLLPDLSCYQRRGATSPPTWDNTSVGPLGFEVHFQICLIWSNCSPPLLRHALLLIMFLNVGNNMWSVLMLKINCSPKSDWGFCELINQNGKTTSVQFLFDARRN